MTLDEEGRLARGQTSVTAYLLKYTNYMRIYVNITMY